MNICLYLFFVAVIKVILAGKRASCWQVQFPHVFMLLDICSTLHCWTYCWIQCLCCSGWFSVGSFVFWVNLFCYQGESRSTLEWYFMYELCFKKWKLFSMMNIFLVCSVKLHYNKMAKAVLKATRQGGVCGREFLDCITQLHLHNSASRL